MKVVDLAMPLSSLNTPMFPGYPQPLRTTFSSVENDGYQSNVWNFVEHTGTHVDAPRHLLKNGRSIEKIPLKTFVASGVVLNFSEMKPRYQIAAEDLSNRLRVGCRDKAILIYTGYSSKARSTGWLDHPDISEEGAEWLVKKKIAVVGTDAPSPDHPPFDAHRVFLSAGVPIFENLTNLAKLVGREFTFVGAPLPLVGGTASPCRPLAIL